MQSLVEQLIPLAWLLAKVVAVVISVVLMVAYSTYLERKVIGYIQTRIGPNRVGFKGLLQPFADVLKLICKEIIVPNASNKFLFILAPFVTLIPALVAWSVVPFDKTWLLANIDAGVLLILALTSLGIYGILIAGWGANSKYAFFGALRSAAQAVSYEIAMGFALVSPLLAAGSTNLNKIVMAQQGGFLHWYWLPLLPSFFVFWLSGVAETNRAPFDVAEGESEIVAGFHVEYSGITFAMFFLAEYANMLLLSAVAATLFLGGWLSPFEGIPFINHLLWFVPGAFWLFVKAFLFMVIFFWLRATFPRYRYDQIMRLGWKVLIPISLIWLLVVALAVQLQLSPWFSAAVN